MQRENGQEEENEFITVPILEYQKLVSNNRRELLSSAFELFKGCWVAGWTCGLNQQGSPYILMIFLNC